MEWPFVSRREYQKVLAEHVERQNENESKLSEDLQVELGSRLTVEEQAAWSETAQQNESFKARFTEIEKILMEPWDDSDDGGKTEAFDRLDRMRSIIRPNKPSAKSDKEQEWKSI